MSGVCLMGRERGHQEMSETGRRDQTTEGSVNICVVEGTAGF